MSKNETQDAIKKEIEEYWTGAVVEFVIGTGKHPKAKLLFDGKIMSVPFSSTPSDSSRALLNMIGDVRRALKKMGAERTKPEPSKEDEAKQYQPVNKGKAKRTGPIRTERKDIEPVQTVAEQVASMDIVTVDAPEPEPDEEEIPLLRLGVGFYDILEEQYHADPAITPSLSASMSKILLNRSPRHAFMKHPRLNENLEAEDPMKFRVGNAFHAELLGKGAPIAVFDHKDWKKKVAKEDRDQALADGYTPLLKEQAKKVSDMVAAARQQISERPELGYAMAGGVPERVYIWEEETASGPIMCRMMVDWTPQQGRYFVDWKTTGVGAFRDWGDKTIWQMDSDIQDAFYRRGFKHFDMDYDACCFAVIETEEPFAMMHHRVEPEAQFEADQMVQWAINAWAMCLHRNRWPGYPKEMAWQSKPVWRALNFEAREANGGQIVDLEQLDGTIDNLKSINAWAKELDLKKSAGDGTADAFGLADPKELNEKDDSNA